VDSATDLIRDRLLELVIQLDKTISPGKKANK
jgi:hypothetical protein